MELNFKVLYAKNLMDGDFFYCTPDATMNEFGPSALVSGTDQILIKDDEGDIDEQGNFSIIVNGGYEIWFSKKEKVVKLGHYADLIRVIEMVKQGHPEMDLGPNDFMTLNQDTINANPEIIDSLLADFDFLSEEDSGTEGEDELGAEDFDLPF